MSAAVIVRYLLYEVHFTRVKEMKILIVEDSKLVRKRLIDMLSKVGGVEICGHAVGRSEALEALRLTKPDIVILDIRLVDGNGIEVLEGIKKERPSSVVIMFTNYPYPQYRKKCMDAGASFFFDKSSEFEKVGEVIEKLAAG